MSAWFIPLLRLLPFAFSHYSVSSPTNWSIVKPHVVAGNYYHFICPLLDLRLCAIIKINVFLGALAGGIYIGMAYGAGCGICEAYIDKVSRASGFEFGRARMFGGIGAAIGTFAAGKLYGIDQNMIFWLASCAGACLLVIVWKMQISADKQGAMPGGKASPVTLSDATSLLKMKKFWFFAIYMIGVGAVYETYDQQFAIYYSHFFESKARGAEVFGYLTTGQIFLDAVVMFFAPWFVNKIGPKMLCCTAG